MNELEQKLINILEEKYAPIMVIYLMGIPDDAEYMHNFAKGIQEHFKYKVLILPGHIENKVELISIMKTDEVVIETLQKQVFDFMEELKKIEVETK